MECQKEKNIKMCNCTYSPCSRKGVCCECIVYHKQIGEIPACLFPDDAKKTYNRSIEYFIKIQKKHNNK